MSLYPYPMDTKPNCVDIKYTDSRLAAKCGAGIHVVPIHIAERLIKANKAILIKPKSEERLIPPVKKTPKQQKIESVLLKNYEERKKPDVRTLVSWYGSKLDSEISNVGLKCGFRTNMVDFRNYSLDKVLESNIIVVSCSVRDYPITQINQMNLVLFQELKPFIFYVDNNQVFPYQWIIRMITRSKITIFYSKEIFESYLDEFGDILKEWLVCEDTYNFWRSIESVLE